MVWATREHMFIKHGCYTMKYDVVGLSHEFEAFRPRSVTEKNHNFGSRSEFIDSDIIGIYTYAPHPNTLKCEMSGFVSFNTSKGVRHAMRFTGVLL